MKWSFGYYMHYLLPQFHSRFLLLSTRTIESLLYIKFIIYLTLILYMKHLLFTTIPFHIACTHYVIVSTISVLRIPPSTNPLFKSKFWLQIVLKRPCDIPTTYATFIHRIFDVWNNPHTILSNIGIIDVLSEVTLLQRRDSVLIACESVMHSIH